MPPPPSPHRIGGARYASARSARPPSTLDITLSIPGIERVAQRVPKEVVSEHREQDEETGIDRQKRILPDVGLRVAEHVAPTGLRRLDAEAEVAQRRLQQDG